MSSTPRKLTTHQKAVLIQVLLAFPEQSAGVHYSPLAADSLAYAQDFLTIFKAVGWKVSDAKSAEPSAAHGAGLAVVVSENRSVPAGAEALRDALRIYGIEIETICDPAGKIAAGSFVLSIGASV